MLRLVTPTRAIPPAPPRRPNYPPYVLRQGEGGIPPSPKTEMETLHCDI